MCDPNFRKFIHVTHQNAFQPAPKVPVGVTMPSRIWPVARPSGAAPKVRACGGDACKGCAAMKWQEALAIGKDDHNV